MNNNQSIPELIVQVCHRLYEKGFVTATDGNVSVRIGNGNFLTTRTGINKGMVTEDNLVEVDDKGKTIQNGSQPSTELPMHIFIYSQRPDVNAVVHAHPPYVTGFATARIPLTECLFPEVIVGLGGVPLAQYATPSTVEVAQSLAPFVRTADAIMLANHGAVAYGKDVWDAYFKMEKIEHAAHITFVARMLGGEKLLSLEELEKLRSISGASYGKDFSGKIACDLSSADKRASDPVPSDGEIRELVRQMLQGK